MVLQLSSLPLYMVADSTLRGTIIVVPVPSYQYIGMLGNGYTVDFSRLDLKQRKVLYTLWNQARPGPGI